MRLLAECFVYLLIWFVGCFVADYVIQPEARAYSMFIGAVTYAICNRVMDFLLPEWMK